MKDVDEALSDYLETYEADEIFNDHFSGIRRAFIAGFKAAVALRIKYKKFAHKIQKN